MRILITGGFGFIGGRLAQHLHQTGHQVILGSRHALCSPEWLTEAQVVQTNWQNCEALERICKGVDIVIHAAGMNSKDCATNPVDALDFNGLATARLVKAACRKRVKRFIYISTAHVYASPLVGTITENTCPRNLHPYATSHLAGENVLLGATKRGEIDGIVLRLSNAFGVPMHKEVNCWMLLVNDLCRQAIETGKMILHSNGLQHRDFIALTSVCRVIDKLTSCSVTDLRNVIFNIGAGSSISVLEMAQVIQQRFGLIYDFIPDLQFLKADADEQYEILRYRSDKFVWNGDDIGSDNIAEINGLFKFCQRSFI